MKQTTKSLVTALVALGVAAAIGGAALWVTKDTEKQAEQKEKSAKLFDGLDKSKVRSVRLSRDGKLVALATRADGSAPWKLTEPAQADADAAAIDAMVNGLADLKQKSDVGEADPKQYGLDQPKTVVAVKAEDGKEQALEFGETNPFDASVYVRKAGEKTVRIADGYAKAPFEKQFLDLRDKRVAHLDDAAEVRRIQIAGTKPPYTLEKDGTAWKLLVPQKEGADAGTADRIASAVKSLRATGVAAESADGLKQYGLAKALVSAQLTVATAGGKETYTRTVLIGQPPPLKGSVAVKTYAKREDSPTVYEVDAQILKDLQKDLFELQDKALVHANREEVRKVVFEQPGAPRIVVERKKEQAPDAGFADETFSVLEPKQGAAKKWKVSSALYSIAGLRAAAFAGKPDARMGLASARTITLLGDADKVLARVRIGSETKDGKRRYVSSEGEPRVAEVEKATLDDLPKSLDDVLEPPPASAPDGGPSIQASNPAK